MEQDFKIDYGSYLLLGVSITLISSLLTIPTVIYYGINFGFSFDFNGSTIQYRDAIYSSMIFGSLIMPTLTGLWTYIIYSKWRKQNE